MREILRCVRNNACYMLSVMGEGFRISNLGMLLILAN